MKHNICLFAFTSSATAISDCFRSICNELKNDGDYYLVGTKYSLPADLRADLSDDVAQLNYRRNYWGIVDIFHNLRIVRRAIIYRKINRVFVFSSIPINGWLSLFVPRNVTFTLWLHDPKPHSGERIMFSLMKKIDEYLLKISRPRLNVLVASKFLQGEVQESIFKNKECKVIPFPYLDELVKDPSDIRQKISGRVIFFGRIESYKGLDWFASALEKYSYLAPQIHELVVVGKGNLPDNFSARCASISSVIIRNEFVSNEELRMEIEKSELAVFPYRDATATQAIQSAGALGCKVVATDVGSLSEIVLPMGGRVVASNASRGFIECISELLREGLNPVEISQEYLKEFRPEEFGNRLNSFLKNSCI